VVTLARWRPGRLRHHANAACDMENGGRRRQEVEQVHDAGEPRVGARRRVCGRAVIAFPLRTESGSIARSRDPCGAITGIRRRLGGTLPRTLPPTIKRHDLPRQPVGDSPGRHPEDDDMYRDRELQLDAAWLCVYPPDARPQLRARPTGARVRRFRKSPVCCSATPGSAARLIRRSLPSPLLVWRARRVSAWRQGAGEHAEHQP
jgi:hypothetical protein